MQLTLDELKDEDDVVIKSQDIMVVYNSGIEEYVKNSIVDYQYFNNSDIKVEYYNLQYNA